jgi:hypothetical protein
MPKNDPINLHYAPRESKPSYGWFFRLSCTLFAILCLIGSVHAVYTTITRTAPIYESAESGLVSAMGFIFFAWSTIRGRYPWK